MESVKEAVMLRMPNCRRLLLVFSAALISLIALAPVAGAACPGVDPRCVTDTIDQAQSGLPDTDDPLGEDVPGPVQDGVDTVQDTAGPVVGQVEDTVDGVLNPGDDGGGDDGGGDDGSGPGGGSDGGKDPSTQGSGPGGGSSGLFGDSPSPVSGTPLQGPASSGSTGSVSLVERIRRGAVGTVKELGFPLVLALIVIMFLMIQDRLDRRDPKLALAPITPDVSSFA
jgi:hypothetical protein